MDEVAPLPSQRYAAGVARGDWQDDPAQRAVLAEFDRLHTALAATGDTADTGLVARLRARWRAPLAVPGLYLWGGVGRGKTFLVDLFFAGLPLARKRRVHFHRFMREVHAALRALEGRADPLREVAADIAAQARVLCLDEFFVGDIGDAMILGGLLRHLVARGTSLVTTSNTAPPNLYRDGLQRERFLPAIALLQQHCRVVEMVSAQDWRLRTLRQARTYLTPPGAEAERALALAFQHITRGEGRDAGEILINDRAIAVKRLAEDAIWFDFAALCEGPRAVADYIEIGRTWSTVLVSGVPQFGPLAEDAARRFIELVDEFYDRRVKLLLSAAAPIVELYDGTRLRAEFARTESRLIEMGSEAYLALEHLA
ncbi:MAG TPA: cell division protein ZapE [Rhodanobacteraceae bacterium]|nr:cell division protein ZapE [Rhodanobacteraceae bacterium]